MKGSQSPGGTPSQPASGILAKGGPGTTLGRLGGLQGEAKRSPALWHERRGHQLWARACTPLGLHSGIHNNALFPAVLVSFVLL